jgi:hypothetical protein
MLSKVASERPSTSEIFHVKFISKHAEQFGINLPQPKVTLTKDSVIGSVVVRLTRMKTFSNEFKRSSITVSRLATVANSPRQSKLTKNVKKVAEIKDVKKVKTDFGRI